MNPLRRTGMFNEAALEKYSELDLSLPPHVYRFAAAAYKDLCAEDQSQVIFSFGDPGSGKSRAIENVLQFLAFVCAIDDDLKEKLKNVLTLLYPFISCHLDKPSDQPQRATWASSRGMT